MGVCVLCGLLRAIVPRYLLETAGAAAASSGRNFFIWLSICRESHVLGPPRGGPSRFTCTATKIQKAGPAGSKSHHSGKTDILVRNDYPVSSTDAR